MKALPAAIAFLLLPDCAHWFGPAHGVFDAVGSTRDGSVCQLSVTAVGSETSSREWSVTGSFRQRVLVNPSHKGHRIALICNGELAAERTFKYGRDVGIGGELSVDGSAPNNQTQATP